MLWHGCKLPVARWKRTQFRSVSHLVAESVSRAAPAILQGLDELGWAVVPNFITRTPKAGVADSDTNEPIEPFCAAVRTEAVAFYDSGRFRTIQHTRLKSELSEGGDWKPTSDHYETYSDRPGVYSMQLEKGDLSSGPRMHSYCKDMARALVPIINQHFGVKNQEEENKMTIPILQDVHRERHGGIPPHRLSVCIGNGSGYDAHYDNTSHRISTREDLRKLTVILYLTPRWRVEHGGQFRIHNPPPHCTSSLLIEPEANTLLVFWSDKVLHSVLPSECPSGTANHRYALAIWLNID